jgi:hypothetical protein
MDIYCINIFVDDRDFDLKPWQQNGGQITEEDKTILREMWRLYNARQEQDRRQNDMSISSTKNKSMIRSRNTHRDQDIKQKLINLGYGLRKRSKK